MSENIIAGKVMNVTEVKTKCDHEWVVCSTALDEVCLMTRCVQCGADGSIDDPTSEEWEDAFRAPSKPYRWLDNGRVHIRGTSPVDKGCLTTPTDMPYELPSQETYLVTLKANITAEIQVEASSEKEAKAKAFAWDGESGWYMIGEYYMDDDLLADDVNEAHCEIMSIVHNPFVEIEVLQKEENEIPADDVG